MKKTILLAVVFLPAVFCKGQFRANSELQKLITVSFTYFPKIAEVENTVRTSEEKLAVASLSNKPDIGLSASYNYVMPKISFPINGREIQFAPVNNISSAVSTNYTLFDFGRFQSAIRKAKTDIEISKDNVNIAKLQLASQVTAVYYNITFFRKAIVIQDSLIEYYKDYKKMAENKMKNGDMQQTDILNLQSNIEAEENRKEDLRNNLNKQIELLEYLTGVRTVEGTEFDFNPDESTATLSYAEEHNPEFKLAKDRIHSANIEIATAKLGSKPKVSLIAAAGARNGFVPDVNDIRFNYLAGIACNIPIYGFGKTKEQVKLQETILKQQQLTETSLMHTFNKDINQQLTDVESLKQRIIRCENQCTAAKEAKAIIASRYRNGVATYLDVTAAASNEDKAAFSKLQYEYQLCLSKIELARLMGLEYWNK